MSQVKWLARYGRSRRGCRTAGGSQATTHPDLCGEAGPRVMSTVAKTGSQKMQAGVGATTSLYLFHSFYCTCTRVDLYQDQCISLHL
jgi:hypothetical protein